jgi:hypothetical protein
MLFMNLILGLLILFIATACQNKETNKSQKVDENMAKVESADVSKIEKQKPKISRVLRESIYFAASLEREALKLIVKNESASRKTLFSTLSYIIENYSGSKKSAPLGLDCSKFDVLFATEGWVVLKSCYRPASEVAMIKTISKGSEYEFEFVTSQWASVLGMSAVLTGSNVKCRVTIVDEKLSGLSCDNWIHQVSEDQTSSTVVKAHEFVFNRNANKQFIIKGGFYKELVQNKKIDIEVPIRGKIKVIEKELKVIDEFSAYKDGVTDEIKKEEAKPENQDVKNQNSGEESPKGQDQTQSEGQNQSEDQNQSEGQNQSEDQNQSEGQNQAIEAQQNPEAGKKENEQQPDAPRRGR